jgi:hypothetical protein
MSQDPSDANRHTRLRRQDIVIIVGVSAAFLVIYFTLAVPLLYSVIPEPSLRTFDFEENEWFEAKNVRIIDGYGQMDRAIINDELFYDINYHSKKTFNTIIRSELDILYGGEVERSISPDPLLLEAGGNANQHIRFFSDKVGMNQIRFVVNVLNVTDNSAFTRIPLVYNIPIYSQEASILLDQNQVTTIGVAVSIPVGFATIFGLIISLNLSRRQIEEMETQNNLQSDRIEREEQQRRINEQERLRSIINAHTSELVRRMKPFESYWVKQVVDHEDGKSYLQHLITDKRSLFDAISKSYTVELDENRRKNQLEKKLCSLLNEFRDSKSAVTHDVQHYNFVSETTKYLMKHLGDNAIERFNIGFVNDYQGKGYRISHKDMYHVLIYPDEAMAKEIAAKLNAIISDPAILDEATKYRETIRASETYITECENALKRLAADIESKGATLQGACDTCIGNYSSTEIMQFKKALDEMTKTDLFKRLS